MTEIDFIVFLNESIYIVS